MINKKALLEDIWARYNSKYNSPQYSGEEKLLIKQVLKEVEEAISYFDENPFHDLRNNSYDLPNRDDHIYTGVSIPGKRDMSDRVIVYFDDGYTMLGYFKNACNPPYYWEFGNHYNNDPDQWVTSISTEREKRIIGWRYLDPEH